MNDDDFNQLAGKIRALEISFVCLTRALEMSNTIDGPYFLANLERWAGNHQPADPGNENHLAQTQAFRAQIESIAWRLRQNHPVDDGTE